MFYENLKYLDPVRMAVYHVSKHMPFSEHQNYLQISVFDGYAVYSISDKDNQKTQKGAETGLTRDVDEQSVAGGDY